MTAQDLTKRPLGEAFRASMRVCAASVSLVTGRDLAGAWHGMAVTSAGSLSMDPPSMMVAINRSASIHPVISLTGQFTLNLMGENHLSLLDRFSRSDMRDQRFSDDDWAEGPHGQPILRGALSAHVCTVGATHDFGTHTVFFGNVVAVILPDPSVPHFAPILWMNGARASVFVPPRS